MLIGHIDLIDRRLARGWAADTDHPDAMVELSVFVDGRLAGTARTDQPSDDPDGLTAFGDGTRSIVFLFDPPLSDYEDHEVVMHFVATERILSKQSLPRDPQAVAPEPVAASTTKDIPMSEHAPLAQPDTPKIACLVIAYRGAPVLRHTLPIYSAAGWDVFVHLDRKASRDAYADLLGDARELCQFVDDPEEVFWGGYSMMQAEFKLIETALAAGDYDKLLLISDDSFPVFPAKELAQRVGCEEDLITHVRQSEGSPFHQRYTQFFFYDHPATMARRDPSRSLEIDEYFEKKIAEIALWRQLKKKTIDVYHGSQFWALRAKSVRKCLEFLKTDVHLQRSFEFSALSDELMMQSLMGLIKSADAFSSPVYADFAFVPGPKTYDDGDSLPYDIDGRHLFIRKISPNAEHLLALISRRLQSGATIYGTDPHGELFARGLEERDGKVIAVLRLKAPGEGVFPGWNGIESDGGKLFRWTASDTIEWQYEALDQQPDRIRFVLVMGVRGDARFLMQCSLTYGAEAKRLEVIGNCLIAEFSFQPNQPLKVTLTTPPPLSPKEVRGHHDTRKLGMAIAL